MLYVACMSHHIKKHVCSCLMIKTITFLHVLHLFQVLQQTVYGQHGLGGQSGRRCDCSGVCLPSRLRHWLLCPQMPMSGLIRTETHLGTCISEMMISIYFRYKGNKSSSWLFLFIHILIKHPLEMSCLSMELGQCCPIKS